METKKILLAEDDPNDIELTLKALNECNWRNQTIVVRDGTEALDYLYQRGQYTEYVPSNIIVILLDLKMPKMGGLEVLQQIKKDPKLRAIPVVILSSSREKKDIIHSYDLGVNAYVVKPVDFNDFIEVIKKLGLFWILTNEPVPYMD